MEVTGLDINRDSRILREDDKYKVVLFPHRNTNKYEFYKKVFVDGKLEWQLITNFQEKINLRESFFNQ